MFSKSYKNTDKYQWTQHAQFKMRQYGLSPQRVVRVIRNPQRTEEGIVPKTIAVMQPASVRYKQTTAGKPAKFWSQEIWAMYQLRRAGNPKLEILNSKPQVAEQGSLRGRQIQNPKSKILNSANQKIRIISAWRYPGVSPKRNPIPDEILDEIKDNI